MEDGEVPEDLERSLLEGEDLEYADEYDDLEDISIYPELQPFPLAPPPTPVLAPSASFVLAPTAAASTSSLDSTILHFLQS